MELPRVADRCLEVEASVHESSGDVRERGDAAKQDPVLETGVVPHIVGNDPREGNRIYGITESLGEANAWRPVEGRGLPQAPLVRGSSTDRWVRIVEQSVAGVDDIAVAMHQWESGAKACHASPNVLPHDPPSTNHRSIANCSRRRSASSMSRHVVLVASPVSRALACGVLRPQPR